MGKRERRRRREAAALAGSPLIAMRALGRTELLRQLVARRREIDRAIVDEIDRLSGTGVGWGEIGAALGVSRQAARQAAIRRRVEPPRQPALSPYREIQVCMTRIDLDNWQVIDSSESTS